MLAGLSLFSVVLILGTTALMLGDVIFEGASHITTTFLTESPSADMMGGGIFPAIYGTVLLTLLMTLIGVPIGVATGIYLGEYAKPRTWLPAIVRAAVQNLAGVPSIVFGLFGLGFFVMFIGRGLDVNDCRAVQRSGGAGAVRGPKLGR